MGLSVEARPGAHDWRRMTTGTSLDASSTEEGSGELLDLQYRYFENRDPELRSQLVRAHTDLAYRLAGRFARRGEPLEDLAQVALVGLILAVDRFDPRAGIAFAPFAIPTILGG